tara:strand:- start:24383 stop:24748 length:366 start_codon:yes stop_codon:yes gene_type:complete
MLEASIYSPYSQLEGEILICVISPRKKPNSIPDKFLQLVNDRILEALALLISFFSVKEPKSNASGIMPEFGFSLWAALSISAIKSSLLTKPSMAGDGEHAVRNKSKPTNATLFFILKPYLV